MLTASVTDRLNAAGIPHTRDRFGRVAGLRDKGFRGDSMRGLRRSARLRRVLGATVAVLALTTVTAIEHAGALVSGQPNLPVSTLLSNIARTHSQSMCKTHVVKLSAARAYLQESAADIHELVGSTPLDMTITNVAARNITAMTKIWASWQSDTALTDPKWTDQGSSAVACADGKLYLTAVLRQAPQMPASGQYSTEQYARTAVRTVSGLQYTTSVDYTGTTIPLLLDLYLPPTNAPRPRPTIVLIHGGAFVGGSRTDMAGVGAFWAMRGYDVASIDYRLDQSLYQDSSPPKEIAAATNATLDAEQALRWLKSKAPLYSIDTTRIAAVGYSAGGAISLGLSAAPDVARTGPLAGYSSKIQAAISTGAYLTPALDAGVLQIAPASAPIMMFHYETDVASNTGAYAFRTCAAYRAASSTCDYISQAGEGHTTDLTPGSVWWYRVGPFIWQNLHIPLPS